MNKIRYTLLLLTALLTSALSLRAELLPGVKTVYHVCEDSVLVINGQPIYTSGEYYFIRIEPILFPTDNPEIEPEPETDPLVEIDLPPDLEYLEYQDTADVYFHPKKYTTITKSICEGDAVQLPGSGRYITKTGTYNDTLLTSYGCDSILTFHVNVYAKFNYFDTATISYKEVPYLWQDTLLSLPGDYEQRYTCEHGCDSIYHLHLNVKYNFISTETDDFCPTPELPYYEWRGQHLTTTGIFYDSLKTKYGQEDSVYVLNLTVHPTYFVPIKQNLCAGSTITFNDTTISTAGSYTFHLQSIYGCDSIVRLTVEINPIFIAYDTLRFCNNETMMWHGQVIDHAGKYYDRNASEISGCDSIHQLTAIVDNCYLYTKDTTVCSTDLPYIWRNLACSETKRYEQHYTTVNGYDSIYRLDLTVHQATDTVIYLSLPSGTYTYEDTTFTKSSNIVRTISNSVGCDSVITLSVAVHDVARYDTIKVGDTYTWHRHAGGDTLLRTEGLYTKVIPVPAGMLCNGKTTVGDTLWLTVLGNFSHTYSDTICESLLLDKKPYKIPGEDKEYWGKWNEKTGHYEDSTYLSYDRQHTFTLRVLPERRGRKDFVICEGEFVERILSDGQVVQYTQPGDYYDTIAPTPGMWQCDSIDLYHITVIRPTKTKKTLDTDKDLPYQWNGQTITCPGLYTDTVRSDQGCKAINVLEVNTITKLHYALCEGDSVKFIDRILTEEGNYTYTYSHASGYDSTIQMTVNRIPAYHLLNEVHIADTTTQYIWRVKDNDGKLIETRTYDFQTPITLSEMTDTASYTTPEGCHSSVALHLYIHPTYRIEERVSVCPEDGNVSYSWEGLILQETDVYTVTYKTKTWGYDSVRVMDFTVLPTYVIPYHYSICRGDSAQHNGKSYYLPGVYTDSLQTVRYGCDSLEIITVDWLDTYFTPLTADFEEGTSYVWTTDKHSFTLLQPGVYRDTLESKRNSCDSIVELTLTAHKSYLFNEQISVCPSETPYLWQGQSLYTDGQYTATYKTTRWGYDSTYVVDFHVHPSYITTVPYEVCAGEVVEHNHKQYTQPGTYNDTLHTYLYGCDSIEVVKISWKNTFLTKQEAYCEESNLPYHWTVGDHTLSLDYAGVFRDTLESLRSGCDSVVELTLTVCPTYYFSESATVCENELPYRWRDKEYWATGLYEDKLKTKYYGFDSIYALNLTVRDTSITNLYFEICHGESVQYNGHTFTTSGIWQDTLRNQNDCDSIVTYRVNVLPSFGSSETVVVSSAQPYFWHGMALTHSGTYTYTEKATNSCDSLLTLYLTVYTDEIVYTDEQTVCEADLPYLWRGHSLTTEDIHRDTVTTPTTDTIYTLTLHITETAYETLEKTFCQGESYEFNGKTYTRDTIFTETVYAGNTCPTVYSVYLRFLPTYDIHISADISDQETYLFNEEEINRAGDYIAHLKTINDCDSTVRLTLNVHPTHKIVERYETCANEPFFWHGNWYTYEGTYFDSLKTETWGYDSIHVMRLTVNPVYHETRSIQLRPGQSITIRNMLITQPGVYDDEYTSIHGCDSTITYIVNYQPSTRIEYCDTICEGESYLFYGQEYTETGTLVEHLDENTTEICHLTVLPRILTERRFVLYEGQFPFRYEGKEYAEPGVYEEHHLSSYYCDSTFRLTLIESQHCSDWEFIPLCKGGSVSIDTLIITKAGAYTFLRRSLVSGELDSLYRVEVYDAPSYDLPTDYRELCKGDTLDYAGQRFWRTGQYDIRLQTREGCDSIMHLDLKVHNRYQFYQDVAIADYETYYWSESGNSYNQSGNYDVTYPSIHDCDSTYTLRLKVVETERKHLVDTMCVGSSYVWRGKTYTQIGYYADTLYAPGSGISQIFSLELHEIDPTIITSATIEPVCGDEDYFPIAFSFTGAPAKKYSILFDDIAKRNGFVNLYDEPMHGQQVLVPMPEYTQTIYQNHGDYVRPDIYRLRLVIDNGICGESRSDLLEVTVRYPEWIIEQAYSNIVAPLKAEHNGGYNFAQYEWYVNGSKQETDGRGYLYSNALREGDEVVLLATRQGENYAIPTCPLVITRLAPQQNTVPVLMYPNAVSRVAPVVTLESASDGDYAIYSAAGTLCAKGHFGEGRQTITLPATSGCYYVQTLTSRGEAKTEKILIY